MKKMINKISKYMMGIWVVLFVLFLVCVLNEDNLITNRILTPMCILFLIVTILMILSLIIHLIWMIKAKRKPDNLKSEMISAGILLLLLIIYDAYSSQFTWYHLCQEIVFVLLVVVFGEVVRYIYSGQIS